MNNTVYQGQTFFDKVLECTGNVENAFEMALLNNLSITEDLVIGNVLVKSEVTNKRITNIFNEKNKPATAFSLQMMEEKTGIDYMIIETNFIVA